MGLRREKRGLRSMGSRDVMRSHASKQTRGQGGDRCGKSGVLHPARWKQGEHQKSGDDGKKLDVTVEGRPKKREGRVGKRGEISRSLRRAARFKTRLGELVVGIFNFRAPAFNGKNGLAHAEEILDVCRQKGCDIVGLLETRQGRPKRVYSNGIRRFLQWIWRR